jgi:hypothetical protein
LLVWPKLLVLRLIALTFRVPLPELVMVRGRVLVEPMAVDGKLNEVADRVTAGPAVAVPDNVTVCGEPGALSVMDNVAEKLPAAVGVKMT